MNRIVNKQNWRFWGYENLHLCEEKGIRLKFLQGLRYGHIRILGPFFVRETITAERCVTILQQFVSFQLALEDRRNANWFMQDGDRPRRTDKVLRFLHEYFRNRVIMLDYPQFTDTGKAWPPYFPDLSPCDFFL